MINVRKPAYNHRHRKVVRYKKPCKKISLYFATVKATLNLWVLARRIHNVRLSLCYIVPLSRFINLGWVLARFRVLWCAIFYGSLDGSDTFIVLLTIMNSLSTRTGYHQQYLLLEQPQHASLALLLVLLVCPCETHDDFAKPHPRPPGVYNCTGL